MQRGSTHDDSYLSLSEAARLLPRRRGRGVAPSTIWRWISRGCRGIHLRALRTPSGWVTTPAAIREFLAAVDAAMRVEEAGAEQAASLATAATLQRAGIAAEPEHAS